jgi:hypothetical protein
MRKLTKPYYCLIAKEDGLWALQFGDYDRDAVDEEGGYHADSNNLKRRDWKVVCGSNVEAIDLCYALNKMTALAAV